MLQPFFKNIMINREDMLALTRRMNVKRTSITRIAGAYIDREGFVDGTFNTRFLKLSASERARNLAIAKAIPFAETNLSLKRYVIPKSEKSGDCEGDSFCGDEPQPEALCHTAGKAGRGNSVAASDGSAVGGAGE